jgi:hypothetical protein
LMAACSEGARSSAAESRREAQENGRCFIVAIGDE